MHSGGRISQAFKWLLLVLGLVLASVAAAEEVSGVKFDDSLRLANQELKLNGAGVRYKAIFKVYAIGLYLPAKKATVPEILALPGARRVTIVMLRDLTSEDFGRAFLSGIHQNTDRAEKAKLVSQLMKFGEIFASIPELKKGDVVTTDWIPGSGTIIHVNGKKIADPIPDLAFYNAILRIWLGDKPADANLKPLLLGEKA